MSRLDTLPELVAQMPDPDDRNMYTENIDNEKIEAAVSAIYEGGPASFQGLIDMLGEPGSAEDVKPHYALHCVLNLALIRKEEKQRAAFCHVLAEALSKDYPEHVKAYLCQELQWAGRGESVDALGALLTEEALCDPAAMALVAIGDAGPLRKALPQAEGAQRRTILHSLAALGDAASAPAFLCALADPDRDVRIAAGAGLAAVGDVAAADALLKAAKKAEGYEASQAKKHCLVLAEALRAAGNSAAAEKIVAALSG